MNLRFLETFIWVARLRSFSLAAERTGTTQAAVSNRIATLERHLGVRLFERDVRSVSLSPHGHRALAQAEEIVRLASEFERSIGDGSRLSGSVMMGAVDSIVYAWLPKLIERVKQTYPRVTIDLSVDTSLNLARQIQDGHIELGLMMGPVVASHIRNIDLCTLECLWIASANLALPDGPLALPDIVDHPIFAFSKGSLPHQTVLRLIETSEVEPGLIRVFNANSLSTVTQLIRDGLGIAVLPRVVVQEFLATGELRVLDIEARLPPLRFHAAIADTPGNLLPGLIAELAVQVAVDFTAGRARARDETGRSQQEVSHQKF